jgi:hypothetical protein
MDETKATTDDAAQTDANAPSDAQIAAYLKGRGFSVSKAAPEEKPEPGKDWTEGAPEGFTNIGDGSEEHPHSLVPAHRW